VLVGGEAWYDPVDVLAWLEANKRTGPVREQQPPERTSYPAVKTVGPKKRGRPTKAEQMRRRQEAAKPGHRVTIRAASASAVV